MSLEPELDSDSPLHPVSDTTPAFDLDSAEKHDAVRSAVLSLPTELREALILAQYEELSHAEIAKILGCSAKAVETRLYRARAILRHRLKNWI
jgi:RNA polymerase sigma-70 factor (ECF subfamily)